MPFWEKNYLPIIDEVTILCLAVKVVVGSLVPVTYWFFARFARACIMIA